MGDLKLHLRTESDGTGVLVINASSTLFLDKVAYFYFESFVKELEAASKKNTAPQDPSSAGKALSQGIVRRATRRFKVKPDQASRDWERLWNSVLSVATGGSCPFSDFEVKRIDPLSVELSAPYRTDLILTYRCQNNCGHCYAGGPHDSHELPVSAWKDIIKKLADWGVPTLVFTGGEPLLRQDLGDLVRIAQEAGCVTGLITNGRLLSKDRAKALADAGLDFVQVTLESKDEAIHDKMVCAEGAWKETVSGIKEAAKLIYLTTNTTIIQDNKSTIQETIKFIKELGAAKFGINALIRSGRGINAAGLEPSELKTILESVIKESAELRFPFIWYTPTCYRELNPIALGLGVKTCSAASSVLAVEPDGNVMPCQSYYRSLGNATKDDFPRMWQHPLAVALRRRRTPGTKPAPDFPAMPTKCVSCGELAMCGGACPLDRRAPC